MVWVYAKQVDRYISAATWRRYAAAFDTVWVASAYKGASGEAALEPDTEALLANNLGTVQLKSGFHFIIPQPGWL